MKAWIKAFRLRTLPLAASSVGMGIFLALSHGYSNTWVIVFTFITTFLLQILSNLANDYGDFENGADLAGRVGPERAVQSGAISPQRMKKAMYLFSILSFVSGLLLLYFSGAMDSINIFGIFLSLGILAIGASIKYTSGKNPYGYSGLGDPAVFLFFGPLAVCGSYYLLTRQFPWTILFAAYSVGAFSTAVLNLNNIRDIVSDKKAGKITIAVRLGESGAKAYHVFLLISGILSAFIYTTLCPGSPYRWLYVACLPLFIIHLKKLYSANRAEQVDPLLKQMALTTLVFVLLFGISLQLI